MTVTSMMNIPSSPSTTLLSDALVPKQEANTQDVKAFESFLNQAVDNEANEVKIKDKEPTTETSPTLVDASYETTSATTSESLESTLKNQRAEGEDLKTKASLSEAPSPADFMANLLMPLPVPMPLEGSTLETASLPQNGSFTSLELSGTSLVPKQTEQTALSLPEDFIAVENLKPTEVNAILKKLEASPASATTSSTSEIERPLSVETVITTILENTALVETPTPRLLTANALEASLKVEVPVTSTSGSSLPENLDVKAPSLNADTPSSEGDSPSEEQNASSAEQMLNRTPSSETLPMLTLQAGGSLPIENIPSATENVAQGITPLRDQITEGVKTAYHRANKTMEIQLNPADLGHMRIQIKQIGEGHISARFLLERGEAVNQITEQVQNLKANLEQQGLKVENIEVVLAGATGMTRQEQSSYNQSGAYSDADISKEQASFQQQSQSSPEEKDLKQDAGALKNPSYTPVSDSESRQRLEELDALRQNFQPYKEGEGSRPPIQKERPQREFSQKSIDVFV
ncbi:MAG: hypothetical protein HEQ32_07995 [Vampirovibrio sp.]